jgi:hypothetical protein
MQRRAMRGIYIYIYIYKSTTDDERWMRTSGRSVASGATAAAAAAATAAGLTRDTAGGGWVGGGGRGALVLVLSKLYYCTDLRTPNRTPSTGSPRPRRGDYTSAIPDTSHQPRWAGGRSALGSTAGTWSAQMGKKVPRNGTQEVAKSFYWIEQHCRTAQW